ncbi:helix-turn-helix domain-containing protein [Parathalassolituus penaei]|uniref:Helix-turn-helix domain-containing protein n=1 Tax=Parathalassolituus penaei TaxID=2997323 RepID=A0A9X3IR10_9GAMM|nr:helix-turn-helix domain-containing protein [Parathalassolituus penaei]MCY0964732.1 helix-turn-helix domain-containing protein [Parathalassolituus penaei]
MSAEVVFLPTPEDSEQAKGSSRILAQALADYSADDRVRMTIQGSSGTSNELVLPGDIMNLLLNVLTQVSQGNAISLVPIHQEISTQQAAELLSVSRPHLVKLLEQGDIPFRKVGSHRRVRLVDVMSYRKQVDAARSQALDDLAELSQGIGMEF